MLGGLKAVKVTGFYVSRNYSDVLISCKCAPLHSKAEVKVWILCTSETDVEVPSIQPQIYWNVVSWEKQPARRNSFFLSTAVSRCGVTLELGAGRAAFTRITNSRMLGCGKLLELVLHGVSSARSRGSRTDSICIAWRGSYAKKVT